MPCLYIATYPIAQTPKQNIISKTMIPPKQRFPVQYNPNARESTLQNFQILPTPLTLAYHKNRPQKNYLRPDPGCLTRKCRLQSASATVIRYYRRASLLENDFRSSQCGQMNSCRFAECFVS